MAKYRFWAIILIALAAVTAFFVWNSEKDPNSDRKFKFGLDISGGSHLVYKADISQIQASDVGEAMQSLKNTIERRVNLFGVSEPLVQVEEGGVFGESNEQRLIVELPGVANIDEAIKRIGETPILEFKLLKKGDVPTSEVLDDTAMTALFRSTNLTGRQLKRAELKFDQNLQNKPIIGLIFNEEGAKLFSDITKNNIGDVLGIFLDGNLIEAPFIREEITGGEAVITGDFKIDDAKRIVRDLNYGALPMPISLLSTQTIGASLGDEALQSGVRAAIFGLILVAIFMIFWYRLPGIIAMLGLSTYMIIMLALFKTIPVTLTLAGIAGFIISIGMAIDANVIIFERLKDDLKEGHTLDTSIKYAFSHAWGAIRDGNISTIISAIILFWFGTSSVEGFALVLGFGTAVSMFSALVVTRIFLSSAISFMGDSKLSKFLIGSGLKFK